MLREINYGKLSSYKTRMRTGIVQNSVDNAIIMANDFNLKSKDVTDKLNISLHLLIKKLNK